ncbi:DUF3347 domain-containing protein [Flavilitoribacter nigricans]|uniref:DUF3347 domain-containing protein n=1 Tax=Flavilitoribacter nigricans (strain ATCC 23147 / DSM 23189 / NBRC 102662 / NCIMB 1420 / SS-2) TaxID=1122177 RepID=A0A2D0N080_FLAN2|nr:DUF3347 domain-containing protein [Flavilitoribacter nigricans]PHN01840.1 hypothetical protein CRP01_34965 [Flavilitoribacter nigricans DSM 23189 = NBRC 102662]
MRTFVMISGLLINLFLVACNGGEKNTDVGINTPTEVRTEKASTPDSFDAGFADGLTEAIFQDYLHLRTAFVNSDVEEASAVAKELTERLTNDYADAHTTAQAIVDAKDLEKQRTAFSQLTIALEPLFKEGLTEGVIYKQYCPMAFDNKGANWFSDTDQIQNPYFGERMLSCGKIVETIQ